MIFEKWNELIRQEAKRCRLEKVGGDVYEEYFYFMQKSVIEGVYAGNNEVIIMRLSFENQKINIALKNGTIGLGRTSGFRTTLEMCSGETQKLVLQPILSVIFQDDLREMVMTTKRRDQRILEKTTIGRVVVGIKEIEGKFVLVFNSGEEVRVAL